MSYQAQASVVQNLKDEGYTYDKIDHVTDQKHNSCSLYKAVVKKCTEKKYDHMIKQFLMGTGDLGYMQQQFKKEAEIFKKSSQYVRNIVEYIDSIQTAEYGYLIQEFAPNQFEKVLQIPDNNADSEQMTNYIIKVLKFAKQMCESLHDLKHNEIYHLDLKPVNIVFDQYNNLKIIDFGISLDIDTVKNKSYILGKTPQYASPEQIFELIEVINEQSDLWSFAVILCELLYIKVGKPYTKLNFRGIYDYNEQLYNEKEVKQFEDIIKENLKKNLDKIRDQKIYTQEYYDFCKKLNEDIILPIFIVDTDKRIKIETVRKKFEAIAQSMYRDYQTMPSSNQLNENKEQVESFKIDTKQYFHAPSITEKDLDSQKTQIIFKNKNDESGLKNLEIIQQMQLLIDMKNKNLKNLNLNEEEIQVLETFLTSPQTRENWFKEIIHVIIQLNLIYKIFIKLELKESISGLKNHLKLFLGYMYKRQEFLYSLCQDLSKKYMVLKGQCFSEDQNELFDKEFQKMQTNRKIAIIYKNYYTDEIINIYTKAKNQNLIDDFEKQSKKDLSFKNQAEYDESFFGKQFQENGKFAQQEIFLILYYQGIFDKQSQYLKDMYSVFYYIVQILTVSINQSQCRKSTLETYQKFENGVDFDKIDYIGKIIGQLRI